MVFKRYITKNGKKIGPYYYENKKVNGKVVSIYLGTTLPENKKLGKPKKSKNIFTGKYKYVILGGVVLLLLATLINFLYLVDIEPTGEASILVEDQIYDSGELLTGIVRLNLNKGELIPANTQILVDNVGDTARYMLEELLTEYPTQGNFYITGTSLSGSGLGYGVPGAKSTASEVEFTMKITTLKDIEEIKQITSQKLPITGDAITESTNEIKGKTSINSPYTYELEPGETAEIIYSSQPVELTIQDNTATITTEYSKAEQGFGEDYILDEKVTFSFDLAQLNLRATQGELKIDFVYGEDFLFSASKTITLGQPIEQEPPEEPLPEGGPEPEEEPIPELPSEPPTTPETQYSPSDKSWWNPNYQYKRQLQITNNMASALIAGYSVGFTMDTTGINFLDNGDDFRIVWENAGVPIEIDRVNETNFDSTTTQIWFKLQQAIPSSSIDNNYYVYYNNPGAGSPPQNRKNVYLWFDDFNRADNPDITIETDYSIKTNGGTWAIENNQLKNIGASGDPNKLLITALGSNVPDVDMLTKINVNSWSGNNDAARMGLSQDMQANGEGYCALFHNDQSSLDLLNDLRSWGTGTLETFSWSTNTWYNMRFRVIDPSARTGQIKLWPITSSEPSSWTVDGNFGTGEARTNGYVGFGGSRQADITYFDDIQIRYVVATEPTVTVLGQTQNTPPSVPTNIQCNGDNNCDITIDSGVTLNALGSTDSDEDVITYFLEAYLNSGSSCINLPSGSCDSCSVQGDCDSCFGAGCSWQSGGGGGSYPIFFEDFESGWQQEAMLNPPVGDCSQKGNFNGCDNNGGDYEFDTTSSTRREGLPLSGSYWLIMEDWDNWNPSAGIWYSFDPSTACGGLPCDSIELSFEFVGYNLNSGEWCGIMGDDETLSNQVLWQCVAGACSGNLGTITITLSDYLDLTDKNWNARIAADQSGTADECFFDEFTITGFKSSSESCQGTLDCSKYSNQGTCESCSQCTWATNKQWIEIGNHEEGLNFYWDTSLIPDQTDVNLRSRAIDLTGSNLYSNNFTKNPTSPYIEISHGSNSPPNIDSVDTIQDQAPTDGSITTVVFNVQISDPNLYSDIDIVTVEFTSLEEPIKSGTCIFDREINPRTAIYKCSIDMQYYDKAGTWNVLVEAFDKQGASDSDNSQSFIYLLLKSIKINLPVGALTWPSLAVGQINRLANEHNEIENIGNVQDVPILITAYDLIGADNGASFSADLFRAGPVSGSQCTETQLQNGPPSIPITGSSLPRGQNAIEEIYYCIPSVPGTLTSQEYSTSNSPSEPWIIAI